MPQRIIEMRKFEYRHPRHRTDVPIAVRLASTYSIFGRCTDVSAEGIGVRFAEGLHIGEIVNVEFSLEGYLINAIARIEYCHNGNYYGMSFQFSSEQERTALRQLIESIHKIK
jgi:hypothetical protein